MAQLEQENQHTEAPASSPQTDSLAQLAALLVPAALAALLPVGRAGSLLKRRLYQLAPEMAERLEQAATPVFLRRQSPMWAALNAQGSVEGTRLRNLLGNEQEILDVARMSRPEISTKGFGLRLGLDAPSVTRLAAGQDEAASTLLHEGVHADLATQRFPSGIPGSTSAGAMSRSMLPPAPSRDVLQEAVGEYPDLRHVYTAYRSNFPQGRALAETMTEYQARNLLRETRGNPDLRLASWKKHTQDPTKIRPLLDEFYQMLEQGPASTQTRRLSPPPIRGGSDAFAWTDPWGKVLNEKEFERYITQVLKSVEWPDTPEYREVVRQRLLKYPRVFRPSTASGKGDEPKKESQYGWR